ncbi:MAG: 3-deoxy-8-phosphooctulonate synthase [Pseudomonadota bacterium]|jgi:2-dehydro-3-deoxyphosphooctonate aldolase (KDO 8-P synthase)|nr:3-deoxy-8-phosphooctulonate synthase [Pseudomonadota bacterium]MEC8000147.1 3-deoxy-8-phosphooctulonate synthase [Pseudomonadota bacterium]|tara:strand:- start:1342 stop:2178 length:837 start_codon:yes stop_codon:yes gene_type:complete
MKQIELSNFSISNDKELTIIGGMNVLESHSLAMQVAEHFKKVTEKLNLKWVFKASFDKANRSSIDSFRGLGFEEGLKILEDISSTFDVPVLTDIHEKDQAIPVSEICEIIQIPAFLCRQTDLIEAAAKTNKIIQFKKPQFLSAPDMRNVVTKCYGFGNEKVLLCERGNIFGYNNLVVDMLNFDIMKSFDVPVVFDVTHSLQMPGGLGKSTAGRREYLLQLARAGISQKIAGLFLETHPNPDEAKCDGPCALQLSLLEDFLLNIKDLDVFVKSQDDIQT